MEGKSGWMMTDNVTDRPFLERFPPEQRSLVTNMFLRAYRNGTRGPEAIVQHVTRETLRRRAGGRAYGNADTEQKAVAILDALKHAPDEALEFARWAIEWENLPHAEREAIKNARATQYQLAWMEAQPATAAQMSYLESLGHRGPVASRAEASRLIDELTQGQRR